MKGRDKMPARGASVGKLTIGPFKLNLVMPKELATMLRRKVIMGRICEKDEESSCMGTPPTSFGKKDCCVMMMANEMCA